MVPALGEVLRQVCPLGSLSLCNQWGGQKGVSNKNKVPGSAVGAGWRKARSFSAPPFMLPEGHQLSSGSLLQE